ncbi:MAG: aldo/keto reductase [Actinomycetota bacterium]|nr:aldo/keto reductase [Actinomycetota bacterium]
MQLKQIGQSGPHLSVVGLGGFQMGVNEGPASIEHAGSLMTAALDAGINWVDTAEGYHNRHNEALIGRALPPEMFVCSKVSPYLEDSGLRPEQIRLACEQSLTRLRREHLDIYLAHGPDDDVPALEAWGAMCALVDDGLVDHVGLSNFSIDDVRACHAQRPVDVLQDGLSLLDYLDHRERFAVIQKLGIPTVVYEPLANGFLTGAITPGTDLTQLWGGDITEWGFYQRLFVPGKFERSVAVVDGMRPIAERLGRSTGQVAIAWTLHQPGVGWALAGSSQWHHVADNAGAGELRLSEEDLAELDALLPLGPSFSG